MNNEKYNQIIDEAYGNYMNHWAEKLPRIGPCTQEEFINKCKTDSEFSEKWGLKIEERELSLKERYDLVETDKHIQFVKCQSLGTDRIKEVLDEKNIPTKLITITYSDIKIESYE